MQAPAVSEREKIILTASGMLIVFLLLLNYWFLPQHGILEKQRSELAALKAKWVEVKPYAEQPAGLEARYQQMQQQLEKQRAYLSPTRNASGLIDALGDLAKQTGVSITSFKSGEIKPSEKYSTWSIDITFNGDPGAALRFLEGMENFSRLTEVTDYVLSMDPSKPGPHEIKARVYLLLPATANSTKA
ncbi:MAG: type 4a pilus biogenesis protein PilO [Clostridia bacterium]|nr:type 4a pilus biogenesis protein PilO [Clostridia bacterium]